MKFIELDLDFLKENFEGMGDVYMECLDAYLKEQESLKAELQTAFDAKDSLAFQGVAHKFKSAVGGIGGTSSYKKLSALEKLVTPAWPPELETLFQDFISGLETLNNEISSSNLVDLINEA